MIISGPDYEIHPVGTSRFYDLKLPGKKGFEYVAYGVSLANCIRRIAKYRLGDSNLEDYLLNLIKNEEEVIKEFDSRNS